MINTLTGQALQAWCRSNFLRKSIHSSAVFQKAQAGRYKVTPKRDRPLTYEMANPPHKIAHRKSWLSWNTSNLLDGLGAPEIAAEDMFIRKFMYGTWHGLFVSEVIIKRRHNIIIIVGIVQRTLMARKMYFLIGFTEDLLSNFLKCPVKLELQSVSEKEDVVFKYI